MGAGLDGNADGCGGRRLHGKLMGGAKYVKSPLGQAVDFDGKDDAVVVPRDPSMDVGAGDFTVSAGFAHAVAAGRHCLPRQIQLDARLVSRHAE